MRTPTYVLAGILCAILPALQAHAGYTPVTSQPGEVQMEVRPVWPDAMADTVPTPAGFTPAADPGHPMLPRNAYALVLAPEADLATVTVTLADAVWDALPGQFDAPPAPFPVTSPSPDGEIRYGVGDRATLENGRNTAVYAQDTLLPASPVALLEAGAFRGVPLARVQLTAARYNPALQRVEILRQGTLTVQYDVSIARTQSAGDPLTHETPAASAFPVAPANEDDLQRYYDTGVGRGFATSATPGTLAIITTNWFVTNSSKLDDYIAAKEAIGFDVLVITEAGSADNSHFVSGSSGASRATNIRSWLKAYYASLGIDYVLLIGDPRQGSWNSNHSIPMRNSYPNPGKHGTVVETDMYYAELSGNWDRDGDGRPGEYGDDFGAGGIDQVCEVSVGRVSYYGSLTDLDGILDKMSTYEAPTADDAWRNKALIAGAVSNFDEDTNNDGTVDMQPAVMGEIWGEEIKSLATTNGIGAYTLYEKSGVFDDGSAYPLTACDAALGTSNLQNGWNQKQGFAMWWAHGLASGVYRKRWTNDNTRSDHVCQTGEISWGAFWSNSNCGNLNDAYPSFVFSCACLSGDPGSTSNLGYALHRNGGIGVIASSHETYYGICDWNTALYGFFGDNASYPYYLFQKMVEEEMAVGDALNWCRANFGLSFWGSSSWQTMVASNLLGDPSMNHIPKESTGGGQLPTVDFTMSQQTVAETSGASVTMTVELTTAPGSGNTAEVDYATQNGTAAAGSDYQATSGTLTFSGSEFRKSFTVTILDDSIAENWEESFTVALSNATGCDLGTANTPSTVTIQDGDRDNDGDGLSNDEETAWGSDPNDADSDNDGLNDGDEYDAGTDPRDSDSDNDGLDDAAEVMVYNSDPNDNDTDNDGLTDGEEVNTYNTSPTDADWDNDGLSDGEEVNTYNTSPTDADTDNDGVDDGDEVSGANGCITCPNTADSDNDGLNDGEEINGAYGYVTDPNDPDCDNDGLTDGFEVTGNLGSATSPLNPDCDGDGLDDGEEVSAANGYITDPNDADTDNDGLDDAAEINGSNGYATNPTSADTDNDGIDDATEPGTGNGYITDPTDNDTDNDGITDGVEIATHGTDPTTADTDGDGLNDGEEVSAANGYVTNPTAADTDGDSITDGAEMAGTTGYVTDPTDADTDGDGLDDGAEVTVHGTDPTLTDSDGEGLSDGDEVLATYGYVTDPGDWDTDDDGISDYDEIFGQRGPETDPTKDDTDNDGLLDGDEVDGVYGYVTDPTSADTDGDGINDLEEFGNGTDPTNGAQEARQVSSIQVPFFE